MLFPEAFLAGAHLFSFLKNQGAARPGVVRGVVRGAGELRMYCGADLGFQSKRRKYSYIVTIIISAISRDVNCCRDS